MDNKLETGPTMFDAVKLFLASGVLVAGIVGYYFYADTPTLVRAIGVLVAVGIALAIIYHTYQGQLLWKFIQGSRIELRKVVWPTREEAIQTTAVVLVFSLIGGIFFAGLDRLLLWITQLLLG